MHWDYVKTLLREQPSTPDAFKRNIVKEYLQVLVLQYIYSHAAYQGLLFYGGSCLRHCYGLDRLSEDLDFVDTSNEIDLHVMMNDCRAFLSKECGVKVVTKLQKFRAYLKFPVLWELGLADRSLSNDLFIKIEVYTKFDFCSQYEVTVAPVFKFGRSLLIRTFDLPTLMSTKIRAILHRRWEKTGKSGDKLCQVKGRDFFDLMWYLSKGVRPNLACLADEAHDLPSLRTRILNMVNTIDTRSIKYDLDAFIADGAYVDNLSKNLKGILTSQLAQW